MYNDTSEECQNQFNNEKKKQMELQKQKWQQWMKEKQISQELASMNINITQSNNKNDDNKNININLNKINKHSENNQNQDQKILTELTMKITEKFQNEIGGQKQFQQPVNKQQMQIENKISKEVESNTCPICFELMVPPNQSPILLFPCGHTFCKECVLNKQQNKRKLEKCGICRAKIQSHAINISLQNLICAYTDNLHLLEKHNNEDLNDMKDQQNQELEQNQNLQNFEENYKAFSMRVKILEQEKLEVYQDIQNLKNKCKSQDQLCQTFRKSKLECQQKIKKLQQEILLIDQFYDENQEKLQDYQQNLINNERKIEFIDQTLEPLKRDQEKYRILKQQQQLNN